MSGKDMICVALDVATPKKAISIAGALNDSVGSFKVGKQLFRVGGPNLIKKIYNISGREVFLDLKDFDIPATMKKAAIAASSLDGVGMFNVHCLSGTKGMKAAMEGVREAANEGLCAKRKLVLGVTLLTSFTYEDLRELGLVSDITLSALAYTVERAEELKLKEVRQKVLDLARMAQDCGLDGVIASPLETKDIRRACGPNFIIGNPGIRPLFAANDDQERIATPASAVMDGADFLVIGRPITDPPEVIGDMKKASHAIAIEIDGQLDLERQTQTM